MNNYKNLICKLMNNFYNLGWCSGTGGGISIYDKQNNIIYMAPSGVQKELLKPTDIFEINYDGSIKKNINELKLSQCAPIFQLVFNVRNAGAVIHSHALEALLITRICDKEFFITDLEMIKGIPGHKNTDNLIVPIIENTENESELTSKLETVISIYPKTYAILVRNHGVYIWGETWDKTKQYSECYHYLFSAFIRIKELNLEKNIINNNPRIWFMSSIVNKKDENRDMNYNLLNIKSIQKLGIFFKFLNGKDDPQLNEIKNKYNYNYSDVVTISKEELKDKYTTLTNKFFEEHFHEDDELRYVLDGSGYFDIKDNNNKWIRIQMTKGCLINIPAGLYHRFTTDNNDYIVAMRIFSKEPKWVAIKPNNNNLIRKNYMKKYYDTI